MKKYLLSDMKGGWFTGTFEPTCFKTGEFEVACKHYKAGDSEQRHVHKIATELTLIVQGRVRMNGEEFHSGDIVKLDPNESSDFHVLEDTTTVVVKSPSILGDKYSV